ncbi:hypothetical protein NAB43_18950 [Proteus mirabilis]|nr:hypothetical protein [Proteus mirabilis]
MHGKPPQTPVSSGQKETPRQGCPSHSLALAMRIVAFMTGGHSFQGTGFMELTPLTTWAPCT